MKQGNSLISCLFVASVASLPSCSCGKNQDGPLPDSVVEQARPSAAPSPVRVGKSVEGCVFGGRCSTPGEFCFVVPGDRTTGQLSCDTTDPANKRFGTSCGEGFYCGPDANNQNGCTDALGIPFNCWTEKHALGVGTGK